jgi:ribosomal protein S18 acetylase RimI-like enzyme
MPDPTFRYAVRTDARAVAALIERAYRSPGTAGEWDSEAHLLTGPRTHPREIETLISDPNSRFVLLYRKGALAGCALIQRRGQTECSAPGSETAGAYFGMFAIDPDVRRGGLGDKLLAECEQRASSLWDAGAMVMTVISVRKELLAWYGRRGYAPTGVRLPFPFTETSGETTRDFHLVELRKAILP